MLSYVFLRTALAAKSLCVLILESSLELSHSKNVFKKKLRINFFDEKKKYN